MQQNILMVSALVLLGVLLLVTSRMALCNKTYKWKANAESNCVSRALVIMECTDALETNPKGMRAKTFASA
jgi:hypothetical protein